MKKMNRNQRKYGRGAARNHSIHDNPAKSDAFKVKGADIEEVLPPKRKVLGRSGKPMSNRCCFVIPDSKDFGQQQSNTERLNTRRSNKTEAELHVSNKGQLNTQLSDTLQSGIQKDEYQKLILQQYGFDPVLPHTADQLEELRKVICGASGSKVENGSQYDNPKEKPCDQGSEHPGWQNIENADDIDKFIKDDKEKLESDTSLPQKVHISEIPRVKIIAEKYSTLKKKNMEVRQLDEKVVCIEYDIYKGNNTVKPKQKLRAFFAVKPTMKISSENLTADMLLLKQKFDIANEDLNNLNSKEIEIIDSKIKENKPYLEDLRRILKRKQAIYTKRNKTSLDLLSLYEMAKKESPPMDEDYSHTNFLSKAELEQVKQLILKKCTSNVSSISRKKVKQEKKCIVDKERPYDTLSDSLTAVLMQE